MNQILLTNNDNNKKKNNIKNNSNKNNSNDIKKIITFFAVVILVFGIAIGGVYGYKIYKNSNKEERTIKKPELSLKSEEDEVTIIAKAEAGIGQLIYQWNEEEEIIEEMEDRTSQEKKIEIPVGENTLKVKVVDRVGQEIETSQTFYVEDLVQENSEKIKINESIIEDGDEKGKLKIAVTSELPIKYMSYKWNEEEEIKTILEEDKTSLETKIDVIRGKNTLTISVEDIEGNINKIDKKFDGRLKPEFEVYRDGDRLYMKIIHDMGFEKIEFNINEKVYTYDENITGYDKEKQELEYYFTLKEGENTVIITAFSNENTSNEYRGKCDL